MEGKELVAGCIGLQAIRETGLSSGAFIAEWQRFDGCFDEFRQADAVFFRLALDVSKGFAFTLGFNYPKGLAIYKKKIVGLTEARHGKLAYSYAARKG
jgi:hypothetical protein